MTAIQTLSGYVAWFVIVALAMYYANHRAYLRGWRDRGIHAANRSLANAQRQAHQRK